MYYFYFTASNTQAKNIKKCVNNGINAKKHKYNLRIFLSVMGKRGLTKASIFYYPIYIYDE